VLREIFGPLTERVGTWRIEAKDELDELIRHKNVTSDIKAQRFNWLAI